MSLEKAIEYAARGWFVFPLLPRSKAPATTNGFKAASDRPEVIKSLWGSRTNLNIGLSTGNISQCWILDVDADKGGLESIEKWENKYGSLPDTLTSKTGGGGKHYFFKIPNGMNIPSNANKLSPGIDLRGTGGYAAIPPSVHPNGNQYIWVDEGAEIEDTPKWLIKLIQDMVKKPVVQKPTYTGVSQTIGDWTSEDVLSMLDVIDAEYRDTWIHVGMALHEGGWPLSMWDVWSAKSDKYKPGEPFKKWQGFSPGDGITMGTLVYMAESNGWKPKQRAYESIDVDMSEFKANLEKKRKGRTAPGRVTSGKEDPAEDTGKLSVGGLVGDTLSWMNSNAYYPQPEISTMNILAALGAVFGRRYTLQRLNTRTNVYMIGIAVTGQGKDNSRIRLQELLPAAGLEQFLGPEEVRSGPGLLLELKKSPSFIAQIDEIGMFMKALFDPKAAAYLREISSIFTKIYSRSGSQFKGGLTASAPDNRTVLNEPNLCIYGTTTLSTYSEAMKKSAIQSGEFNRFIILKAPIDFPFPNKDSCYSPPPESLVSRWAQFVPDGWGAEAGTLVVPEKITVMMGETAREIDDMMYYQREKQQEYHSRGLDAMWVRYRENTLKVAMILAIARDHKKPELIASDIEFGKNLVESSIRFMMKFATENMYENEFQKKCSEFMDALKCGATSRTKMNTSLRIKTKELDEIERALKEQGRIDYDEKDRPKKYTLL